MTLWKLDPSEKQDLLDRFLRYVAVDTQSDDNATCFPSTEKQKDLARILVEELRALGCADAAMDEWGYVTARVPANLPAGHARVPVVGFIAHLDTYHATPGAGVKPRIIRDYPGGDIVLGAGEVLRAGANPTLAQCVGHTLVTTDGTTLLGADDKAGIAEILTLLAWLRRNQEFRHGELRIGFTPDEEVGRGTEHFDVAGFGAQYAYTLDGSVLGEVEDETFCADTAILTITGHDVHPGYAKGVMVNALRVAGKVMELLPPDALPETTEDRQPYLHPFALTGDVTRAELKLLVRAFTEEELTAREDVLRRVARDAEGCFPGAAVDLEIRESYRNMIYKIAEDPKVLDYALEAVTRQGITPIRRAIRGGTDGARLSYMGLPTPNIFAGGQSFHSVQEWVSLEWMAAAVEVCVQLLGVWVEKAD
ncbi:peptidase T [Mesoterricola silvestris]|uniref:Peptidase T n=1 Tax=Mesoterricola silvestris TaxID=2927979 RepID=A0AA48GMX2_9BACT|nr:peptidase T [Mesoterricola silvestris]BDU72809.1 peptidase T [Mesoterricola silvestris]